MLQLHDPHSIFLPTRNGAILKSFKETTEEDISPEAAAAIEGFFEVKKSPKLTWRLIKYIFVGLIGIVFIGCLCFFAHSGVLAGQLGFAWGLFLIYKYTDKE